MSTSYYNDNFRYVQGHLYCENVNVSSLIQLLSEKVDNDQPVTPLFLYSKSQITANIDSYKKAMCALENIPSQLNFSMKANMNPTILKIMKDMDCSLTLVSGMELQFALKIGFQPESMVLNGTGKQDWEIKMAVEHGCLLNIDSPFNCRQMMRICRKLDRKARVLIRVNPNIHVGVHQYISTGNDGCKFGVDILALPELTTTLKDQHYLEVVGLHCHLGSTISDSSVFRRSAETMMTLLKRLRNEGFSSMKYLNLGGGLGIEYTKHKHRTERNSGSNECQLKTNGEENGHHSNDSKYPSPADLLAEVKDILMENDVKLILEPGRSLVGNAAILVTSTLGVKKSGETNFIVVDGAMTEVIRPCLYTAYHHIDLVEPSQADDIEAEEFQIVGPVCESADFLGKNRFLPHPHEGCLLAVFDTGAYCSSMASTYNMRPRPAEILVDGEDVKVIRQRDTFTDLVSHYT